jgi:hypothetical protein
MVEQAAKLVLRQPANRMQQREWHIVPNDGRLLQQVPAWPAMHRYAQRDGLHRGRHLGAGERPCKAVAPAYPSSTAVSTNLRTISSTKNGFPLVRSTRKLFRLDRLSSEPNTA